MNPSDEPRREDALPWNESNPEWWRAQLADRGEHTYQWLVNEWAARGETDAEANPVDDPSLHSEPRPEQPDPFEEGRQLRVAEGVAEHLGDLLWKVLVEAPDVAEYRDRTEAHRLGRALARLAAAPAEAERPAASGTGLDWDYIGVLISDALDYTNDGVVIAKAIRDYLRAGSHEPEGLDVPGFLIARAAHSIHVSGEGDECDGSDELWCSACWAEAVAWTDPNTAQPALLEVDAAYVTSQEASRDE